MEKTSFITKLFDSIGDNVLIFIFMAIAVVSIVYVKFLEKTVHANFKESGGKGVKVRTYYLLDITYTIFITIISIFPLLGMLGTVISLIQIDMSDPSNVDVESFFFALTSTAWGIIFAVIFKLVNAFIQPSIENHIEKAKEELGI